MAEVTLYPIDWVKVEEFWDSDHETWEYRWSRSNSYTYGPYQLVVKFDLNQIPAGTINSATLYAAIAGHSSFGPGNDPLALHQS